GRFSYLHPERNKHITGRMLGTHYEEDYLRELFKENAEPKENKKKTVDMEKYNTESEKSAPHPIYCKRKLYQSCLSSQICVWWLICRTV
ncbi:MAG: hypothetical protein OSJ60_22670, partial [Lachnospiraceae bacterium]|nr:hypothetical protein [Lachnospiraceae bacterium]